MTDCADVSVMQAENESLKATVLAQNTELLELRRLAAQQSQPAAGPPSATPGWAPTMQQLFAQYCQMMQQVAGAPRAL